MFGISHRATVRAENIKHLALLEPGLDCAIAPTAPPLLVVAILGAGRPAHVERMALLIAIPQGISITLTA